MPHPALLFGQLPLCEQVALEEGLGAFLSVLKLASLLYAPGYLNI